MAEALLIQGEEIPQMCEHWGAQLTVDVTWHIRSCKQSHQLEMR